MARNAQDGDRLLPDATFPEPCQVTNWQDDWKAHGSEKLHNEKIET